MTQDPPAPNGKEAEVEEGVVDLGSGDEEDDEDPNAEVDLGSEDSEDEDDEEVCAYALARGWVCRHLRVE